MIGRMEGFDRIAPLPALAHLLLRLRRIRDAKHSSLDATLGLGRADNRDGFAFVTAKDSEVFAVGRENGMRRIQFAHADETEVGQIGFSLGISLRQR